MKCQMMDFRLLKKKLHYKWNLVLQQESKQNLENWSSIKRRILATGSQKKVFLKAGPSNELHRTSKTVSLTFTHSHANTH